MMPVLLLLWSVNHGNGFNDFPSLIRANATMAVVIDKSFFGHEEDHRKAMGMIFDLVTETVKQEMRMGGIVVHLFRDINVTFKRDYTILLSVATCHQTWHLHELARKEELIHLAITDTDCPRIPITEGISIPLILPGGELPQIFIDLRMMDVLTWNVINILHDDTFDRDTISRVMKALSDQLPGKRLELNLRSIFTLKHGGSDRARKKNVRRLLDNFPVEELGRSFLVIATVNMVVDVMETARSLKMVNPNSQWLFIITDNANQNETNSTLFVDLLAEGGNVAFIHNMTEIDVESDVKLMCYVKLLVKTLAMIFESSFKTEVEMFESFDDEDFQVFRLSKQQRRREVLKMMRMKLFRNAATSDTSCGKCCQWRFYTAITWGNYFLGQKNMAHLLEIGTWVPEFGVNLTDFLFPHVVHGFRGITLPIATYHNPPWQIISTGQTGEKSYEGLIFDVIKHLGKKLNFTFDVINSQLFGASQAKNSSRLAGSKHENKIKTLTMSTTRKIPEEIIDLVTKKHVLLAACAYTTNDEENNIINFTVPIFVESYSFLTSRPRQLSRALLFASPFTKETWACLAVSIIIMGPILYLVHKYSPCSIKTSGLTSSWQCVWYVYGALLQQGGMYLPQSDSARLLVGVWWLVVMVVVATYSGSLVAFLTFPKMDASILTVEDLLARKDRITWGFPNGSFLEDYLRNSDEEKYQILLSHSELHNDTEDELLLNRIKNGKHALIDWRSSLRFLMRKDLLLTGECHFSLGTEEFMHEPIAMIVAQESPYLSIINKELHRMVESGLMNKWISERMPMKDKCWETAGSNQAVNKRKVNVADMQGIFFVLFMGITLAVLFLSCEFYWHRRKILKERKLIRPFVS